MMQRLGRLKGLVQRTGLAAFDWASLALGLSLSVLLLTTFQQYGFTYDEPNHIRYGEHVLDFWLSGFSDERALSFGRFYGGGFDLFAAVVRRILPHDEFTATHFACIFVALCGYWGTWSLGRAVAGPAGGFWALLFLALTPVYYAHQFNNMKDLPFAVGYVCALRVLVGWVREAPLPSWKTTLWLGLTVGLAMCVRIAGIVMLMYLGLAVGLKLVQRAVDQPGRSWAELLRGFGARGITVLALAWAVLVLPWPWALQSPVLRPFESFFRFSNYQAFDSGTLLHGKEYPAQEVPWDYLPSYLALQLSEVVLLLGLFGVGWMLMAAARSWPKARQLPVEPLILLMALLFPPLYAISKGSTMYDGLRQYLFLVPVCCVIAAIGLCRLASTWAERWRWLPQVAFGVSAVALLPTLLSMIQLHPYQHLHFNALAGGLAGAGGKYDTEYYGSVYKQLHQQLFRYVWERDGDAFLSRDYQVTGCGTNWFFNAYLPANMRFISRRNARRADFYSTYRRYDCHRMHRRYPAIMKLEREGLLLALVRDMNANKKPKRRRTPRKRGQR